LQALIPLKGAVDTAVCPAAAKAAIRDRIAALTKRCLEAAKAAAAANKEAAAAAAMAAADAAVDAGKAFVVLQLQVRSPPTVIKPHVL
jgi:alanyl-tRNA synthetase